MLCVSRVRRQAKELISGCIIVRSFKRPIIKYLDLQGSQPGRTSRKRVAFNCDSTIKFQSSGIERFQCDIADVETHKSAKGTVIGIVTDTEKVGDDAIASRLKDVAAFALNGTPPDFLPRWRRSWGRS